MIHQNFSTNLYNPFRRTSPDLLKLKQLRNEIESWIKIDQNSRYHISDVIDKLRQKLYG